MNCYNARRESTRIKVIEQFRAIDLLSLRTGTGGRLVKRFADGDRIVIVRANVFDGQQWGLGYRVSVCNTQEAHPSDSFNYFSHELGLEEGPEF